MEHEMVQILDLADENFKAAFIHRSKDIKKTMALTNIQIGNASREIKTI